MTGFDQGRTATYLRWHVHHSQAPSQMAQSYPKILMQGHHLPSIALVPSLLAYTLQTFSKLPHQSEGLGTRTCKKQSGSIVCTTQSAHRGTSVLGSQFPNCSKRQPAFSEESPFFCKLNQAVASDLTVDLWAILEAWMEDFMVFSHFGFVTISSNQ